MAFRRTLKQLEPPGENIYGFFLELKTAKLIGQPGEKLYEHSFG